MESAKTRQFRALIEAQLERLAVDASARRDQARPVELDQARVGRLSRQEALQSQALSVAALERSRAAGARLRAALRKLDSDDYGWCEECGAAIPEARLRIDPAADYCVACAQRLESP